MIRAALLVIALLVFAASSAHAQGVAVADTVQLASDDSVVFLGHDFLVEGSLEMTLDRVYRLQTPLDYIADTRYGIVRLTPFFRRLLSDSTGVHTLALTYRYRPFDIPESYASRRLVERSDTTDTTRRAVAQRSEPLTAANIFGREFHRSGYVGRGFTVGSNRDLTLQSGLRLQFSGKITDNVEVLGAVTDEQTPIQPEGNTQTLREVDNIFIEFRSPYVGGTIGKFTVTNRRSEYTGFSRKLQGVTATGRFGPYGSAGVVIAVSPGKFRTQQIAGRERDQGPYRLTGPDGERTIIVLAGTEHVYVDGVAMVRGENNDYVIDYSTAEIVFQTRRPITSASRIVVDFQYTDQQYSRSFIASYGTGYALDSVLSIGYGYVREADDPSAPIDLTLDDHDRALLTAAGADRLRAVRSGATLVGRDSIVGTYIAVDTVIDGARDTIYRYAPDSPQAVYNVVFSLAPDEVGDYENVAFGQYQFVGHGRGRYLPVIFLPFPQLRQIGSITIGAHPGAGVGFDGEVAFSDASLNRFSNAPGVRPGGLAFRLTGAAGVKQLRVGAINFGAVNLTASARYLDADFRTIDRISDVEFDRQWNTTAPLGESGTNDFIAEGTLSWRPVDRLDVAVSGGTLLRGDLFGSTRATASTRFTGDSVLPSIDYAAEMTATRDSLIDRVTGTWFKQRGGISKRLGPFTPGLRFEYENRADRPSAILTDTLMPDSFRYLEAGPDLAIELPYMTATARVRFRLDDSARYDPAQGRSRLLRDGSSQTWTLSGALRGVSNLTSTLDFTYRTHSYDSVPLIDPAERLDASTILARSQTRWTAFDRGLDLDALYEVQTEEAARLQRVFVRVPYGQGQYVWVDLDSNGIQTEDEFRLTNAGDGEYQRFDVPTEQLYPVIDLRSQLRLRAEPANVVGTTGALHTILAPITSETFLRVEEKSRTERESEIYLLNLGAFQNDSTTLAGSSTVQEDLYLFERNPEYSFRLRYLDSRALTRLYNAVEHNSRIERSLRVRWQPTWDVGLELNLGSSSGALRSTDTLSTRTFDLSSLKASSDFSYHPEQALELGWIFKVNSSEDVLPTQPRTTFLSSNEVRAIYSIETHGQLEARLERTVVTGTHLGDDPLAIPYELTDGYAVGTTWIGTIRFRYRFGGAIEASLLYTGRAQPPTNRVIHTGTAELRAFF